MINRILNQKSGIRNRMFILILASCFLLLASTPALAQSVDLLWHGDTYTPPFYQGKALWSKQSQIIFLAIPHGVGNPANLNYKWTRNGTVLGNISGIGRNTFSFFDSILSKPQIIKVDIISGKNTVLASASVTVVPISPTLMVYENNPLYGFMFHKETGGAYKLQGEEITFTAFPFFFSALERVNNTLSYEWRTNVGLSETGNSVTYRIPDNTSGSSQVSVKILNTDKIMQSAGKSFLVQFGE